MIVSDLLKDQGGIRHGFFTREGGYSSGIYASLNCGFGSRDDSGIVERNRVQVASKLGVEAGYLLSVHQIHSDIVIHAEHGWAPGKAPQGDALVTSRRGLAIGVLTADCTPILFCDAENGVIGAAHAGWRGAKAGIISAVINAMVGLGAARSNIHAAIGPTISQPSYEVGVDFKRGFCEDSPENEVFFKTYASGKPHFDLPGYCLESFRRSGIDQVHKLELCTYRNESLFYSYRRSVHQNENDYGRQISAIVVL